MQPVTIQLMYNDNKEIIIPTENQRCVECVEFNDALKSVKQRERREKT